MIWAHISVKDMKAVSIQRASCLVLAAVLLSWPALFNGYPLLYPDSTDYLANGAPVVRAIFLHHFADYYGIRCPLYSLGIFPAHWNLTLWPVVFLNGLLTAYVLWLLVRLLLPRHTLTNYLCLVVLLSFLTTVGWFVGFVMPDILGPLLYLSFYLIVFFWEALARVERFALMLLAGWAITSHATHLLIAGALSLVLIAVLVLQREPVRRWLRPAGSVAMVIAAAVLAQFALNGYLHGQPSLNGERPPFLLARVIADGPGRWYLQQRCSSLHFAVCDRVRDLPDNTDDFLWTAGGVWPTSSVAQQQQILKEEMPIVLGVLRAYPRDELIISARHLWEQLGAFELAGFDATPWVEQTIEAAVPGSEARYRQSREAQGTLHEEFFTDIESWTVKASLVVICVWLVFIRKGRSRQLIGLAAVIAFVVIANAAVTGILSNIEDRYQARVIWMVPLFAALFVLTWFDHRRSTTLELTLSQSETTSVPPAHSAIPQCTSTPGSTAQSQSTEQKPTNRTERTER